MGKDYALSCPFHEGDDTPSLIISPGTNLFNCFGCGAGGSVIDWVMKTQGISFRHAVELLRDDHLVLAADKPLKKSTVPKLEASVCDGLEDQTMLRRLIGVLSVFFDLFVWLPF